MSLIANRTIFAGEVRPNVWFADRVQSLSKVLFQRREIKNESMLEPLLELVPAAFDGVQFRKFQREVPDFEVVTVDACDRTVPDSFGRSVSADVLLKDFSTNRLLPLANIRGCIQQIG